ncbi:MAG: thiolase family protein [Acidobacteria bacterium]|nr:MAG: thiolase family protein [Acidobacteriota bacterium]
MAAFDNVYIPYGGYWSTPFCKWQGSFATLPPIPFAAEMTRRALEEREIDRKRIDGLCLGLTIPSHHSFYGAPWLAGLAGLETLTGPTINQACATSARCVALGAQEVATGQSKVFLAVAADRTSNGPHVYYPNPAGPGGTGEHEDWVLDSFGHDPFAKNSMIQTAENVAKEAGISREEQEELTLLRHRQYQRALADGAAFQRRYMLLPVEVRDPRGRKVVATVEGDEGVYPTTREGLQKLKPVLPGGTVTFGTQTYPADGNAGMLICGKEAAKELSRDPAIEIRVLAFAQARVGKGLMPMANVPASRKALEAAGIDVADLTAVTTHVPFAVNDVYLARELGIDPEKMNRYGCSLIWGHPQGPTGLRALMELIEDLAGAGGGYGLFTGCAAGDSAAALVIRVTVH